MFYSLREDVKIHKNLDENYLSFIVEKTKGILQVNNSGYEILSLCNEQYTKKSIIEELEKKYPNDDLESMVSEFLEPFIQEGIIHLDENYRNIESIKCFGSRNYYSPYIIMLELTNYCPLDCMHCYLGKKENSYVSKKDLQMILKDIADLGVHYVQLTGGEVLTYPHLEYAIDYLIKNHIQVNISTSGIICNDEVLRILSKIKETGGFIKVSLDGLKHTHDLIRQNNKSFSNAISLLRQASNLGIKTQVATCIVNQNQTELYNLTKLIKNIGVSEQVFERVYLQGNANSNDLQSGYTHNDFTKLLVYLADEFSDEEFTISTENTEYAEGDNCGAGYKMYKISYNLEVTPCITMNHSLGNLNKQPFKEIIKENYEGYKNLQMPCQKICGNCEMLDECEGCISKMSQYKNRVKFCRWYEQQAIL